MNKQYNTLEKEEGSGEHRHHEHEHPHKDVKIYIDRIEHESPEHTTGAALYVLGKIDAAKYDLWREVQGKHDDELVENNANPIKLKEWEHFYSAQKSLNPGNGTR